MIRGLPDKLKELRSKKNLSQKDVATRLGISPSIVSGYETGERTPSTESLLSLSYLYHCSTDYLLGKTEEIPIEVSFFASCPSRRPHPATPENFHLRACAMH